MIIIDSTSSGIRDVSIDCAITNLQCTKLFTSISKFGPKLRCYVKRLIKANWPAPLNSKKPVYLPARC